jgi:hypothetical protein
MNRVVLKGRMVLNAISIVSNRYQLRMSISVETIQNQIK